VCVVVKLGVNLMAWSGTIGPAELELLPGIRELGYDGVELPIFDPAHVDSAAIRGACETAGLACTVSSALPRGSSLLAPADRDAGIDFIGRLARTAAACGARIVCGPLYAPVGALPGRPRTREEWDSCVTGLREAGRQAADEGITLAIEVLNRFETHFLNTTNDALELLNAVDHPAVRLHLDTFHMNVEERSLPAAVRRGALWLAHVHAAENDRGSVGSGHVDWPGVRTALTGARYDGWIVAETFTSKIPEIAAATAVWRPLVEDGWAFARESGAFLRWLFGQATPARGDSSLD
jgi:D-psicose/D-tagatose/L-ribulose 3-epimerase